MATFYQSACIIIPLSTFVLVSKRYVAHVPVVYIAFITLTHLFAHCIYTTNMYTLIIKIIVYTSTLTFLHTTNSLKFIDVFRISAVSYLCYFKTVQRLFILWNKEINTLNTFWGGRVAIASISSTTIQEFSKYDIIKSFVVLWSRDCRLRFINHQTQEVFYWCYFYIQCTYSDLWSHICTLSPVWIISFKICKYTRQKLDLMTCCIHKLDPWNDCRICKKCMNMNFKSKNAMQN